MPPARVSSMAEDAAEGFDLDTTIAARLDGRAEPGADTHLQALAVLIDADLSESERADAFASVMATMLASLSAGERDRFGQIAEEEGEVAAMSYLSAVTRPVNEADRR